MTTARTGLTLSERVQANREDAPSLAGRFWEHVDQSGECWPWTAGHFDTGYGCAWHEGRAQKAHRVAWMLTRGPIPAGLRVLHRCDNPTCVRPDHLWLGTAQDNTRDMVQKRRHNRHGRRVLTLEQVLTIRRLRAQGQTLRAIADQFGVSWVTISLIASRKRWAHVPEETA